MRFTITLFLCALLLAPAYAKHNSDHPLSAEDWRMVMERVHLLEDAAFIPSLLPFVMTNRDALALTDEQVEKFDNWRKEYYVRMVNLMNAIIEKKVQFSVESLSKEVSSEHLIAFQSEIHQLQRELLMVRMTCRELIMNTFTDEQWENFAFLAESDKRLASFFSQVGAIAQHTHRAQE